MKRISMMVATSGMVVLAFATERAEPMREAAAAGVPVQVLDPRSRATLDFAALAEEVTREPITVGRELGARPSSGPAEEIPVPGSAER